MQLKKLLEQRSRARSVKEQADITLEIAVVHTESGEHSDALREYRKLLELWQSKGNKLQCAMSHRFIADCCIELGEYDQAISHTNQYLKLATELGNKLEQQRAFVTLGRCFLNRSETMRDGDSAKRNLKSAAQALLNSIKMITEFTGELDSKQLGEMRAVSLLNLGQVFRAQRERTTALERFTQCISLARKYQLQKLFFRACYQIADLSMNTPPNHGYEPVNRANLISLLNSSSLRNVMTILHMALMSPMAKTNLDHEAKELLKNLRESLAQIYLCVGQFRKAAKVYRLLKLHNPNSSDYCRQLIRKCMRLSNLMHMLPESVPVDLDGHRITSHTHERMGDLYSGLEMYGPALRHYKFMLTHAEKAYDLCATTNTMKLDLTRVVDAALVSVAETYRALSEYDRCVDTYRREIGWVTATSLSSADLASSWFSLAQAQRLTCETDQTNGTSSTVLSGSSHTADSLNFALQAARSANNVSLTTEILDELIDYHQEHHNTEQLTQFKQERVAFGMEQSVSQQSSEEQDAQDANAGSEDNGDNDDDAITQFTEALSSDSEVERCVGHAEVLDEFHDGHRGKRQGKALCLKTNMKGETPLHVAAINGDMDHVIKLIEVLAHPVNVTDGAGWLPIHEAAFHDRTEVAIYLLDHGARLDDPGCPLDMSTPLFEAIHNGSLTTALVLVQRGADLWHRNKQGECLPQLLDSWQPVRRVSSTFAQQRALFDRVLSVIKERLGADYERWCNLRRASPSQPELDENISTSSDSASSIDSPKSRSRSRLNQSTPRRQHTGRRRRRSMGSPTMTDYDDKSEGSLTSPTLRATRRGASRPIRGRDWDDLLVDLDDEPASVSEKQSITRKLHAVAVKSYREAMQAVGGSTSRTQKRSSEHTADEPRRSKRRSVLIDADDDGWLVHDEPPSGSRDTKCPTVVRDHFDTMGTRRSERARTVSTRGQPSSDKLSDISHLGNIDMHEFNPSEFLSSTQIASSKQTLFTKPTPSTSTKTKTSTRPVSTAHPASKSSLPAETTTKPRLNKPDTPLPPLQLSPVPKVSSKDIPPKMINTPLPPPSSQPVVGSAGAAGSRGSHCSVKVAFADISVLVPVDDSSRSVAWLADEAYRRRQILTGQRPSSTPDSLRSGGVGTNLVRLSTRDGALLLYTDRLHSVLPALGQTAGSVIELLAELLHPDPSTSNSALRLPAGTTERVEGEHRIRLMQVEPTHSLTTTEDRAESSVPRIVQTRLFKTILERAHQTGIVDLSYLALGDLDCSVICDHLLGQGQFRAITELYLSGNGLTTIVQSASDPISGILAILVQMAPHLTSLHLACNLLRARDLLHMLDILARHLQPTDTQPVTTSILLPRLQCLNISHNTLIGFVRPSTASGTVFTAGSMSGDVSVGNDVLHWTELIERLIVAFPKLARLNLVGCSLDVEHNSKSATPTRLLPVTSGLKTGPSISALSELDLSWNSQLSASNLAVLLAMPSLAGLRSLRLRGCSSRADIQSIPTSLPVNQTTLASCVWFPGKSKVPDGSEAVGLNMSAGDRLVDALATALSKGHFRLQLLDLGYCQLTIHSLDNLRSLFGTPGTSLTTIQLDHNPELFKSTPPAFARGSPISGWIGVLQATAQTASAVASLTIDMPEVNGDDDALSTALSAVEAKLLPGLSSTPLQELVVIGAPDVLDSDSLETAAAATTTDNWTLTAGRQLSNAQRFCQHLSTLFRSRFGTLARVRSTPKGDGICYGIV